MDNNKKISIEVSDDLRDTPIRVAYVKSHSSIAVERQRDEEVMTFPHLIIREALLFQLLLIVMVIWSLFIDAPLEGIANPEFSPNPSKAPWYFLGLQELLHFFPPIVAGVLLPALVIIALIVIPYFSINWDRSSMWEGNIRKKFFRLSIFVIVFNIPFVIYKAAPLYVCSIIIYSFMILPLVFRGKNGFMRRISRLGLADWIMSWFLLVTTVLILIGVFFRGPEWRWIWPWIDGIY